MDAIDRWRTDTRRTPQTNPFSPPIPGAVPPPLVEEAGKRKQEERKREEEERRREEEERKREEAQRKREEEEKKREEEERKREEEEMRRFEKEERRRDEIIKRKKIQIERRAQLAILLAVLNFSASLGQVLSQNFRCLCTYSRCLPSRVVMS
jgi:flagellar biosynthesis GTPase FlhF